MKRFVVSYQMYTPTTLRNMEVRVLKTSPLNSIAGTLVKSTTKVQSNVVREALQTKPLRVVSIASERLIPRTPDETITDLLDSIQNHSDKPIFVQRAPGAEPDEAAIREELRRILKSKTFSRAAQMSYLLEWMVTKWLAGETELLDGYHILMAIFHRPKASPAAFDSTGRVYVGRLRAQLERYYKGEGAGNDVRVEIPVGKYVPVAHHQSLPHVEKPFGSYCERKTVMVLPFRLAGSTDTCSAANPLMITDHLISRLTRTRNLRVTSRVSASGFDIGTDARLIGQHFGAQFIVEGTVSHTLESCDLTVHLSETADGYNIWTGHYQAMTISPADLSKRIVRDLLRRIKITLGPVR
jgi:TolB-like protein